MALARASIAELLGSGITLTVSEAVAIARAALAFDPARATRFRGAVRAAAARHDFRRSRRHRRPPCRAADHPEVALFLRSLLPAGSPGVPGGLRYAIARAVGEVDAPPFASRKNLQSSCRVSRRPTVPRSPMGCSRAPARTSRRAAPSSGAARTVPPSPISGVPCAKPTRSSTNGSARQTHRWRRRPVRARRWRSPRSPRRRSWCLWRERPRGTKSGRWRRPATEVARTVPAAGDIVLEAPPRKLAVKAVVRAQKPKASAAPAAPAKSTKNRGFFARLHLQWLKKAFS